MSRRAAAELHPPSADPVSEDGRQVSEEVYWRDYYDRSDFHYEWNNGRLEEKPVSDAETYLVYAWLRRVIELFLETHPVADTIALEMGFRLALADGPVVRKPDFAVVRRDNPRPLRPRDNSYPGIFDLCVEALSDLERADIERDAVTKKREYAAIGVREYYILAREARHRAFYTRTADGLYVPIAPEDGTLASRVLPGFRFRLGDLDERRDIAALSADPVYADFVLPQWQHDRQRAQAETRRAEAEAAARRDAERRAAAAEARARELERRLAHLEAQSDPRSRED